uniref:Receptor-type tyrosine-protein phosphatase C n=1 Tax=Leptobrachium leishanense TaxID=445787 RepID=A0A8C5QNL7_9ANUR
MIRCLHLLVVGFLLWNQNLVAGQITATDNSIKSLPHSGNESPDSQAPTTNGSDKVTYIAITSMSALTSRTATNTTSLYSSSGSTPPTTQAPTLTSTTKENVLPASSTSAPNDATTGTSDYSRSADIHSSPTTNTTTSTTPGPSIDSKCVLEFERKNYTDNKLILILKNGTVEALDISLDCGRNLSLDSSPYSFPVSKCELPNIICSSDTCKNDIPFNKPEPPEEIDFTLRFEKGKDFIKVSKMTSLINCDVKLKFGCHEVDNPRIVSNSSSYEINGLKPYTEYNCSAVLLYNDTHITNITDVIRTKIGVPDEVTSLTCSSTNSSITVQWGKPKHPNGPDPEYNIKVKNTMFEAKKVQKLEYTFSNLKSFVNYEVKIVAVHRNEVKEGPETVKVCQTTPGKPDNVHVHKRKVGPNNAILITCDGPKESNGKNERARYILIRENEKPIEEKECKFFVINLNYLTTYKFQLKYHNGFYEGDAVTFSESTRYNDKALIGFLAFLIVVTSIALLLVLYKIYRLQKKSSSQLEGEMLIDFQDEEGRLLNIQPIPVENLLDTYKQKNADEGRLFLDEFQSIPRVFSKFCIKEARRACNQSKNRYIDILPYDDNRVVLSEISGEPGSDYINASYINGFKEPRKYIAAQGPKEETMNDFWRMIWEQKSTIIVMVTRCEEGNRNKCAQYWPTEEGDSAMFGDIEVTMREEKFFPDYISRKLHITHKRDKSERDVTHIQFTVWPDHGVPDDPNLLLKLRRRIKSLSNFFSGPIVIHCSAGVGRTGTYISIDAMLEGVEDEGRVDVYGYVVQLRRQRCLMVQVESQYIFIHKALVEYNEFGETEINMLELPLVLNDLKKKEPSAKICQLESEFKRIPTYRTWRPQSTGICLDNKEKNRDPRIIPYEYNRVQIKQDDGQTEQDNLDDDEVSSDEESECEDSTKYINASYLTGYWGTKEMIAAQGPLENTISDFWQMIYQKRVKAIVMLSGPSQKEKEETCFPYWVEKKTTHEDLEIELNEEKTCSSYTQRFFEIRHSKRKDTRNVCQFHYDQWEGTTPKETKDLLEMIKAIKQVASTKSDEQTKISTVLVHCSDGSQLTGTFYVLWNLLESANVEGVIDVFQSVKNIRKQRPGMVPSYEHYLFLHDILASTVPAQNGQIKTHMRQEDKLEIQNELETKSPEGTPSVPSQPEESGPIPTDHESSSNGPSPAPFTEVALRIDE